MFLVTPFSGGEATSDFPPVEVMENNVRPLIRADTSFKGLPCYRKYEEVAVNAKVELEACSAGADDYEGLGLCIIEFGVNLLMANNDFEECLRNNYPKAGKQ